MIQEEAKVIAQNMAKAGDAQLQKLAQKNYENAQQNYTLWYNSNSNSVLRDTIKTGVGEVIQLIVAVEKRLTLDHVAQDVLANAKKCQETIYSKIVTPLDATYEALYKLRTVSEEEECARRDQLRRNMRGDCRLHAPVTTEHRPPRLREGK